MDSNTVMIYFANGTSTATTIAGLPNFRRIFAGQIAKIETGESDIVDAPSVAPTSAPSMPSVEEAFGKDYGFDELDAMTVAELRDLCKSLKLKIPKNSTKVELIQLVLTK